MNVLQLYPFSIHSLKRLLEKVGMAIFAHIQKSVDIQVFQNISKSLCFSF